jgi:hypothetical protein
MKLETFVWKVPNGGTSMTAAYTGEELDCALENHATFTKPSLQFSGRLKYLHLDALQFGDTSKLRFANSLPLLSFWLTGDAAGSIKRFGTSMAVVDMRTWPYVSYDDDTMRWTNVTFAFLQNLTSLELGIRTCYTISLSDVVDALTHLHKLTITALRDFPENDIWRNTNSDVMKPHHRLIHFITQVGFRSVGVMKQTLKKFPNLKRLEMFGFDIQEGMELGFDIQEDMELDEMFDVLLGFGRGIQSLAWKKPNGSRPTTLLNLFEHICKVIQLKDLQFYELSCTFTT